MFVSRISDRKRWFFISAALLVQLCTNVLAGSGDLDPSFGQGGLARTFFPTQRGGSGSVTSMAYQPDGKVVVVGSITETPIINGDPQGRAVIVRHNADGSLDSSFAEGGTRIVRVGIHSIFYSVYLLPDGKIMAVGGTSPFGRTFDFLVCRFTSSGNLDTTFSDDGIVVTSFDEGEPDDYANAIVYQPDGKFIAGGASTGFPSIFRFGLARYDANGSLDQSFGENGKVVTLLPGQHLIGDLSVRPDGKILASGEPGFASGHQISIARYNSDGTPDSGFGTGGLKTIPLGPTSFAIDSFIQSDGKTIVAGRVFTEATRSDFLLHRYLPDGSVDIAFGDNGVVVTNFGTNSTAVLDVAVDAFGRIIAAGGTAFARYRPDGSLDVSFGDQGKRFLDLPQDATHYSSFRSIALQPNGRILAGGIGLVPAQTYHFLVARLRSNSVSPIYDFDDDGKTDYSVFRPSNGLWITQRSEAGYRAAGWGFGTDTLVPADYDGDGKTDLAVYRPSNGEWSIFRSSDGTIFIGRFGAAEDIPRPADFDGDGRADINVFRPSLGDWYRINSSTNQFASAHFGQNGDVPLIADFDGDERSDVALYRPSNGGWYWLRSSDGQFAGGPFGTSEDIPVPADFDGDGKSDLSVFRPSTGYWFRLESSTGAFVPVPWGFSTDKPVVGDYDGDGKADIAVWRPETGVFYTLRTNGNQYVAYRFGASTDVPIPSVYGR
jgi:uncharacterized delta-60 repeat protein